MNEPIKRDLFPLPLRACTRVSPFNKKIMTPPPLYLRQNPKQKQFFDAFPIATLAFQSELWLAEDEITPMSKFVAQMLLGTALLLRQDVIIQGDFFNRASPDNISRLDPPNFAWTAPSQIFLSVGIIFTLLDI